MAGDFLVLVERMSAGDTADAAPSVAKGGPAAVGSGGGTAPRKVELARRALREAEAKTGVVSQKHRMIDRPMRSFHPNLPAASEESGPAVRLVGEPPRLDTGDPGYPLSIGPSIRTVSPAGRLASFPGSTAVWSCQELAAHVAAHTGPGFTVSVEGSMSVLFAVAAAQWGRTDWGVMAALPDAGLLAARQAGIPLERVMVVPDLGAEPLRVLAALIDTYGVVLTGPIRLTAADRRRIEARVRHRRVRLVVGGVWPGARVAVEVESVMRDGIGQGHGMLGAARVVANTRSRVHELWGQVAG